MTVPISIKPKDLMCILGLSHRQCVRKLKAIRLVCNKESHQYVTIEETADYFGLPAENLVKRLENHGKQQ